MHWCFIICRGGLNPRSNHQEQVSISIGGKFDFDSEVEGLRAHVGKIKEVSNPFRWYFRVSMAHLFIFIFWNGMMAWHGTARHGMACWHIITCYKMGLHQLGLRSFRTYQWVIVNLRYFYIITSASQESGLSRAQPPQCLHPLLFRNFVHACCLIHGTSAESNAYQKQSVIVKNPSPSWWCKEDDCRAQPKPHVVMVRVIDINMSFIDYTLALFLHISYAEIPVLCRCPWQ